MAAKNSVHAHLMELSQRGASFTPRSGHYARRQTVDMPRSADFDVREAEGRAACAASGGALAPIDWEKLDAEEEALRQKHAKGAEA